jgi:hypothetical protein
VPPTPPAHAPPRARRLAKEALCAPLPEGWVEHLEPDFGLSYYRHPESGRCTWRHPMVRGHT